MEKVIVDQQEQDQEAMSLRLQAYVKQLAKIKREQEEKQED